MAFAVQFLRRMSASSECTELDEEGKKEIDAMLFDQGDWKERRLQEMFQETSSISFTDIADGIGAIAENGSLKLKYMGSDVTLTRSGFTDELGIWDKFLVLMYIKNAGTVPLTGKWVAFRDLKDGLIRAESFHEECEMSLARIFGKKPEGVLRKLSDMGSISATGFTAKYSLIVYPLPKIPFLVLLWPGDEEFDPGCRILFDSTVTEYLDVEALLYLGMALVKALGNYY